MMKVTILGSTGSIGVNTLDVIARHPQQFSVFALTAHTNVELLVQQCIQFRPTYVVLSTTDNKKIAQLTIALKDAAVHSEILVGIEGLAMVASHAEVETVVAAIVGAAGLLPTLAAVKAGKRVLLANKEALVMSGAIFMQAAAENNAILLPVDSEHNAIFQCMPKDYLPGKSVETIKRIILTASGGALRDMPLEQLAKVTPAQACAHPNWVMGQKITIDCATMMNKGFEVIEAFWLFQMPLNQIEVLLHPQSIVHSLLEYVDGSVLAQLGNPDMRTPLAHALAWPERVSSGVAQLDLLLAKTLEFLPISAQRYPCLQLAYDALNAAGTATAILNAANEIAVAAFLAGEISFVQIVSIAQEVLSELPSIPAVDIETVLEADFKARELAQKCIRKGLVV